MFPSDCTDGSSFLCHLYTSFIKGSCVISIVNFSSGYLEPFLSTKVILLWFMSTAIFLTKSIANPNSRGDPASPCLTHVMIWNRLEKDQLILFYSTFCVMVGFLDNIY